MAEPTLDEALTQLSKWLAASQAIASGGQSYSMGTFSLTRTDSDRILAQINYWKAEVSKLRAKGAAATGDFAAAQPGVAVMRVFR